MTMRLQQLSCQQAMADEGYFHSPQTDTDGHRLFYLDEKGETAVPIQVSFDCGSVEDTGKKRDKTGVFGCWDSIVGKYSDCKVEGK